MFPENQLILTRAHWRAMRRHAARCLPLEACGLLAGRPEVPAGGKPPQEGGIRVEAVLGVRNAARSPVRFRMEPRAQWRAFQRVEAAGLELVGIYHSHPDGPDHPSPTDLAEAMYPVVQLIWFRVEGKWRARAFRLEGRKYTEVALEVVKSE